VSVVAAGLAADFVEAAADPEVPAADLGVLAQELDAEVAAHPEAAQVVLPAIAPLLVEGEGAPLYITAVLVGGMVERGASPEPAAPLLGRVQVWLHDLAEGRSDPTSWINLDETWRAAVAVIGAWPEARAGMQDSLPDALAAARAHAGAAWLARLLAAPQERRLEVEVPARGATLAGRVTGVADLLQLAILVNHALGPALDPEVVACARGEGPQVLPRGVQLPWALGVPGEGEPPEHTSLPELFGLDELIRVVATPDGAPRQRPVGRAFATLRASLTLG